MEFVVVYDQYNKEYAADLANTFTCDSFYCDDVIPFDKYDIVILVYNVSFGRCVKEIENVCLLMSNLKVALIGIGAIGFDVNKLLINRLKYNNNLVIYSRYITKFNSQEIYNHINEKYICTDGKSASEIFIGRIFRMFKRNI